MTTETTKHTEEWEVEDGNIYERAITKRYTVEVNGEMLAGRHGLVAIVYERREEPATNGSRARLIAAAPEMAELLRRIGRPEAVFTADDAHDQLEVLAATARALLRRIDEG